MTTTLPTRPETWSWARTSIGFRPEYLDFDRGIHVGNLEPHERITRILKAGLEARYGEEFVTERWGRGVFWQWIGFLTRSNRKAKPVSSHVSFGCSKFFVEMDTEERRFKCGLQVERGFVRAPREMRDCQLRKDWDWQRLVAGLKPRSHFMRELRRLVDDEFEIHAGSWSDANVFRESNLPGAAKLKEILDTAPPRQWCGFQVYFAIDQAGVQAMSGGDLIDTMMAVFEEVTPVMNECMQVPLAIADISRHDSRSR